MKLPIQIEFHRPEFLKSDDRPTLKTVFHRKKDSLGDENGINALRKALRQQGQGNRHRLLGKMVIMSGHITRLDQQMNRAKRYLEIYLELGWLADAGVTATNEGLTKKSTEKNSYSRKLGQTSFFVEFERSLQSLHCFNLIVEGTKEGYQEFVGKQAEPKLTLEHFQALSQRWKNLVENYPDLNAEELHQALQVGLVLGDIGKSPMAREKMADLGIDDPDHDDFYAKVITNPEACKRLPSFCALSHKQQELLRASAGLAHFGHITHCEGGPEMYSNLKRSGVLDSMPHVFDFAMLMHISDVAGALAQKDNQGSLTYNDDTFQAVEDTIGACQRLMSQDELGAYDQYLAARVKQLDLSESQSDRILARLGAMLRLFTPKQGAALRDGFAKLDKQEKQQAIDYLSPEGASQFPRTPTYMPAVLVNLLNNRTLGSTPDQRLTEAIRIGIPFITATLKNYKDMLEKGTIGKDFPINFNSVAGIAAEDPFSLQHKQISIDPLTGMINATKSEQSGS
jgi:hypothetical protein